MIEENIIRGKVFVFDSSIRIIDVPFIAFTTTKTDVGNYLITYSEPPAPI